MLSTLLYSRSTPQRCALWGWGPVDPCVALVQWWSHLYPRYSPGVSVGRICLREVGKEGPGSLQVKGLTKDLFTWVSLRCCFPIVWLIWLGKEAKLMLPGFQSIACIALHAGFRFCWTLLGEDAKDMDDTRSWSSWTTMSSNPDTVKGAIENQSREVQGCWTRVQGCGTGQVKSSMWTNQAQAGRKSRGDLDRWMGPVSGEKQRQIWWPTWSWFLRGPNSLPLCPDHSLLATRNGNPPELAAAKDKSEAGPWVGLIQAVRAVRDPGSVPLTSIWGPGSLSIQAVLPQDQGAILVHGRGHPANPKHLSLDPGTRRHQSTLCIPEGCSLWHLTGQAWSVVHSWAKSVAAKSQAYGWMQPGRGSFQRKGVAMG